MGLVGPGGGHPGRSTEIGYSRDLDPAPMRGHLEVAQEHPSAVQIRTGAAAVDEGVRVAVVEEAEEGERYR